MFTTSIQYFKQYIQYITSDTYLTSDTVIYLVFTVLCIFIGSALYQIKITFFYNPRTKSSLPPLPDTYIDRPSHLQPTGSTHKCYSPATNQYLGEIKYYTSDNVKENVKSCRQAQYEYYNKTSFTDRKSLLYSLLDYIVSNQDYIIHLSTSVTGKVSVEAAAGEILTTCEKIRWLVNYGEQYLTREYRNHLIPSLLYISKVCYVDYHPIGVMGIIVPWNYPVHNVISHVVTSLLIGNGSIVKVSDYASYTAPILDSVFRKILCKHGINPNLVQILSGDGTTGSAIVENVDKVLFIGSPNIGRKVMSHASNTLTPCILELGGKDPFIICKDADFKQVIDTALLGAYINNGQNCISAERFYVHTDIYHKFINAIHNRAKTLITAAPTRHNNNNRNGHTNIPTSDYDTEVSFGAIVMPSQINVYKKYIEDAMSKGAKLIYGGKQLNDNIENSIFQRDHSKGNFFELTILSDVNHTMDISNEEVFGPIMTIIKYNNDNELINMINSSKYGLGCSIFTCNLQHADNLVSKVKVGMCSINDFASVPLLQCLPFGGLKDSGYGHFNGIEGLREFTHIQSVVTDRFPFLRTYIPGFLQYPYHKYAKDIVIQAVYIVYGKSYIQSIVSIGKIIKLLSYKNKTNDKNKNQ